MTATPFNAGMMPKDTPPQLKVVHGDDQQPERPAHPTPRVMATGTGALINVGRTLDPEEQAELCEAVLKAVLEMQEVKG